LQRVAGNTIRSDLRYATSIEEEDKSRGFSIISMIVCHG